MNKNDKTEYWEYLDWGERQRREMKDHRRQEEGNMQDMRHNTVLGQEKEIETEKEIKKKCSKVKTIVEKIVL